MTIVSVAWQYVVGELPYQVTAYERLAKGGVVYLRWRASVRGGRNWKHKSLGFSVRDTAGRVMREAEKRAHEEAARQLGLLVTGLPAAVAAQRVTLRQGRNLAFEPQTGKYPTDTPHRREVSRALDFAMAVLGEQRTWESMRRADLRKLWRTRIEELSRIGRAGHRGAVITISRLLAVAEWLRGEELIPATACVAARTWREELTADWRDKTHARSDYEPSRPRHTVDEMRRLLAVASQVDPRFALLMALGAELRLGQVARAHRSDIDLTAETFTVRRRGKKRGTVVRLTAGQMAAVRAALGGYLLPLESRPESPDYPLFPQGQLAGGRKGEPHVVDRHTAAKSTNGRTIQGWFREAEALAGIPHIPGRGTYGVRRAAVDGAKDEHISREALKEHGGWSDTQMPDAIYASQESERAREEAKVVRAKIRGESVTEPVTPRGRSVTRKRGSATTKASY